jgi:adenylate cyclase
MRLRRQTSFFEELKRRNVFRVGIAYLVGSWLLLQVIDVIGPIIHLPETVARYVLFLLAIGVFPALILAWAIEMTAGGGTGQKLDRAIIVILVLAVGLLLTDKFILQDQAAPPLTVETSAGEYNPVAAETLQLPAGDAQNSVAILPFVPMSNGPDDDYFSDGLTEEIINALAQLPELLVTARTSAFHFKGRNVQVGEIARQLGVDHIVEGSVRRAGEQLRITAQLIRAKDGFHLWSETYDRRTEDTFAVQEDIAEKIATALDVVMDDKQRARMRRVGVRNVEAYIAYQKGSEYFEKAHGEGDIFSLLRQGNQQFDRAIVLAPDFHTAYLRRSDLYAHTLLTHANGELSGNISQEDLDAAPLALKEGQLNAIQSAGSSESRLASEFDMALTQGDWQGLSARSAHALGAAGCSPAFWSHLASGAFGQADLLRDAYARLTVCDPLQALPWVHLVHAYLWLGEPKRTIETARGRLQTTNHQWVVSAYVRALAAEGRPDEAKQAINDLLRYDDARLFSRTMLAAQTGDAQTARALQQEFLGKHGPNDYFSLMMAATQGDRNEANSLAGLIDGRPYGYMTLMQAIYYCTCGAPFDREAAPVFSSMLEKSGLPWPPASPIDFPLKDW